MTEDAFNPTPIYDETREATLIDPTTPVDIESRPPADAKWWFTDRTDPAATQLMPAVKPKGTR